jgi:hypothetical protein
MFDAVTFASMTVFQPRRRDSKNRPPEENSQRYYVLTPAWLR